MSIDKVLAEILENGLGPAYQEEIRKRYQCDTAEGLFEPEEREYDAGIAALAQTLSPEKMAKLTVPLYSEVFRQGRQRGRREGIMRSRCNFSVKDHAVRRGQATRPRMTVLHCCDRSMPEIRVLQSDSV